MSAVWRVLGIESILLGIVLGIESILLGIVLGIESILLGIVLGIESIPKLWYRPGTSRHLATLISVPRVNFKKIM